MQVCLQFQANVGQVWNTPGMDFQEIDSKKEAIVAVKENIPIKDKFL